MNLAPFPLGMNNREPDSKLPEGSVRNLVNVDVSNTGSGRRRKGIEKIISLLNGRDGFSCEIGTFFVEGARLKQWNDDDTVTNLFAGISKTTITYEYWNGVVYFSDGSITRKIYADGTVTKWGMEPPASPELNRVSGSYNEGVYKAAVTFVDDNGVESGASEIVSITARADSGIKFENLPTSADPQVAGVRLYLSMPNGKTLFYIGQVALGTATYSVLAGTYDDARYLETEDVFPPPPGLAIRYHSGRMYIITTTGVWYTDEYALDHCRPENFLQFPNQQKVMEPVDDGIYFADDSTTEFYQGAGPPFTAVPVFNYGGILGTGKKIPDSSNVTWMSLRGQVIAGPGGQAKNIQEENVATELADSGASLIREEDGIRHFVVKLTNPTTSRFAARSFIEAEVIRKGA